MSHLEKTVRILLFCSLLIALPASAFEVEVTVENVSPDGGVLLTPVWVGFHQADFDSYDGGAPAADFPGLEEIAEDGNAGPISDSFAAQVPLGVQGVMPGPNGPIFPGDSASMRFDLEAGNHTYFSYVSMVIPSNDAFIANGNPRAHRVFDVNGVFTPFTFYVFGREVNDAGTEVNDEIPANTAALAQAAPNTGVDENGVVFDHPGFIPGGNVLAARPNGQFIVPGYTIAKVTVRAVPTTSVRFRGDQGQEVPPSGSDATAACSAALNSALDELTVKCEHDVANVTAAHVHLGAAGTNGPVEFPFDDPASPFSQTFPVNALQLANLLDGNYYVNIHSDEFPAGEIRGQIEGCITGPNSLCLNGDRFQTFVEFETFDGTEGTGQVISQGDDSGLVYFFDEDNVEMVIKVLNGCADNGNYWVFASGVTNVGVDVTVVDTLTGDEYTINTNVGEAFPPTLDNQAFPNSCP